MKRLPSFLCVVLFWVIRSFAFTSCNIQTRVSHVRSFEHVGNDLIKIEKSEKEPANQLSDVSFSSAYQENNHADTNTAAESSRVQNVMSTSVLLLNLVAILWGSQHAVIKTVIQDSDPGAFTFLRFGLAALLASPFTPGMSRLWNSKSSDQITDSTTIWRWGFEMGFWMFLGFSFQAIGLEYTTAQKSGFLLYLNVKFVPFLARILLGRDISASTWISALTAFAGTALLATAGSEQAFSINQGDVWSIAAAVSSAMFILRLERASAEVSSASAFNAACLWVVAVFAGLWTFGSSDTFATTGDIKALDQLSLILHNHWIELLYLSGVTTALANWIQTKAQRDVSAERASVIYAMDPVYGAAFSWWLLGETLQGFQGWVGAALITLAAATNAFVDLSRKGDPIDTRNYLGNNDMKY